MGWPPKRAAYNGAFRGALQPYQSLLRSYINVRKLLAGVVGFEAQDLTVYNQLLIQIFKPDVAGFVAGTIWHLKSPNIA
jgi:hypothetical protein